VKLLGGLTAVLIAGVVASIALGETSFVTTQYVAAFRDPGSVAAEILWQIRAPRAVAAALVGAALGLSGGVMQGLLRNPLADPGVLGVSAVSALGAATCIALGLAVTPGLVEAAALAGALAAGVIVVALAARLESPQTLILLGVALSAMGGAGTALVFNLSPSPIATADVLSWLLGSVANRDWDDIALASGPMLVGAGLCVWSGRGLRMLTLGSEGARLSGLPMGRLRMAAVAGAALLTGASVAMAGVIGFVGLAAPHLVRASVDDDPAAVLAPSAIAGAILLVLADLAARMIPTAEPLKLGVMTALVGGPLFALIAWRASRSWR
jgi:iron complex transport system permease protein